MKERKHFNSLFETHQRVHCVLLGCNGRIDVSDHVDIIFGKVLLVVPGRKLLVHYGPRGYPELHFCY